ncbi:unnamed protein product [Orchesella dallaii]|uniref:Uncharacterized protein n=1 Tax=Orchesella dallaii TaxID=48710 RepID=A0ABP1RN98_9HEXA
MANERFEQRIIDIINQCRYLSSKRGMNLKELRKSLREDEAKQRQFIRQNEKASQMNLASSSTGMTNVDSRNIPIYPPWYAHANSHGMLYSQYNVQNYGQDYTHSNTITPAEAHPIYTGTCNKAPFECNCNICRNKFDSRLHKDDYSEDNLMAQRPPTCMMSADSSGDEELNDESHLVSLLYTANKNEKKMTMSKRHSTQVPISRGRTSIIVPKNTSNINGDNLECTNPLVVSDSFVECNLPVRKLASHDLSLLRNTENDDEQNDFSEIMANTGFTNQDEDSMSENDDTEDNSRSEKVEVQVIEELDDEKRVVSPLIKEAESKFAKLQKNDTIFGSIDDFGRLMCKANSIL